MGKALFFVFCYFVGLVALCRSYEDGSNLILSFSWVPLSMIFGKVVWDQV